jgi:hypothetical protein
MYPDGLALKKNSVSYVFSVIIGINSEVFHGTTRVFVAIELRCGYFEIGTVKI